MKPCTLSYFLAILTPMLKACRNMRTQREMLVRSEVLDQLTTWKGLDIVAQRLKALEQSVQDGTEGTGAR